MMNDDRKIKGMVQVDNFLITKRDWKWAKDGVWDGAGIEITDDQLTALLTKHRKIAVTIIYWGACDTEVRGMLSNALCLDLLGEEWPTYGDKVDRPSFFERFHAAAVAQGYKLVPGA